MKTNFFILFFLAIAVQGQNADHWWFQRSHDRIDIQDAGGEVICIGIRDSLYEGPPIPRKTKSILELHVLDKGGSFRTHELINSEILHDNSNDWEVCMFNCTSTSNSEGEILIAVAFRRYRFFSTDVNFQYAGPLRLFRLHDGLLTLLAEWETGANPQILTARDGRMHLVWEQISRIGPDPSDARYGSMIHAVSITPEMEVGEKRNIGAGFTPVLAERDDGAVFVLRQTAAYSSVRTGLGLCLQRIDSLHSSDIVVSDGHSMPKFGYTLPNHIITRDRSLLCIWSGIWIRRSCTFIATRNSM